MDEYLLNDLLECSVCLDRLDTSSKVLPCQHTFCKKCLDEIVLTKKELRCAECRILVQMPVAQLPPNVLLMRILEGMKNAGNPLPKRKSPAQKPTNSPANVNPGLSPGQAEVTTPSHVPSSTPKQVQASGVSTARALYDYQSLEPGDLTFRKGELITVYSKIDTHWAQGECNGRTGIFPLPFVQLLTPLPVQVATCRALYDFRMNNEEVEGCLSFRKDDMLSVLRRVDENWIEGRLNGRIGIFPLAFVELNSVAKNLIKLSANEQPGPSRLAPPTPTADDSTPLIPADNYSNTTPDRIIIHSTERPTPGPMTNARSPGLATSRSSPGTTSRSSPGVVTTRSPGAAVGLPAGLNQRDNSQTAGSDSTTSPSATPNSSSVSSGSSTTVSSPASPQTNGPPLACGTQQASPSVQAVSPQQAAMQTSSPQQPQRSSPSQNATSPPPATSNPFIRPQTILLPTSHITTQRDKRHSFTAVGTAQPAIPTNRHSAEILNTNEPSIDTDLQSRVQGEGTASSSHDTSKGQSDHSMKACVPTRSDVRGIGDTARNTGDAVRSHGDSTCKFRNEAPTSSVTESTGQPTSSNGLSRHGSQRHRRSGSDFAVVHLPAAYVALYPYKPQKADELELKKGGVYLVTERCQDGWFKGTSNRTQKIGVFPGNYVTLAKPASNSHSRVVSSSPRDCSTPNPTPVKTRAAALRQGGLAPPELPPRSASPMRPQRWGLSSVTAASNDTESSPAGPSNIKPDSAEVSNTISPPPNVSVMLTSLHSTPKSSDKIKEKKEKSGIMKRLAAIKRSKSPTVPGYSMDNPVFEDTTVAPVHHSRSGSCPTQLISLPVTGSQAQRVLSTSLSARATRQKERPIVGAAHFTNAQSGRLGEGASSSSVVHRKSCSLDAGDTRNAKHMVLPPRERFRCIVPYPPNSEYELELRVGDIIYVHRKREDGWYKGTQQRTGRTGLFPASFVESYA